MAIPDIRKEGRVDVRVRSWSMMAGMAAIILHPQSGAGGGEGYCSAPSLLFIWSKDPRQWDSVTHMLSETFQKIPSQTHQRSIQSDGQSHLSITTDVQLLGTTNSRYTKDVDLEWGILLSHAFNVWRWLILSLLLFSWMWGSSLKSFPRSLCLYCLLHLKETTWFHGFLLLSGCLNFFCGYCFWDRIFLDLRLSGTLFLSTLTAPGSWVLRSQTWATMPGGIPHPLSD